MGAKPVSAYLLSSDQFQLYVDTDGFFVSEMMPVPGTATGAAMVFCRMQLVSGHTASHSILIDAEPRAAGYLDSDSVPGRGPGHRHQQPPAVGDLPRGWCHR